MFKSFYWEVWLETILSRVFVCICVCVELCEGRRVDTEGFTFRILLFWQKQKTKNPDRQKIYIYSPTWCTAGRRFWSYKSLLSLLLNTETTLVRHFSEPEPSGLARECPGLLHLPQPAVPLRLPPCGSRRHHWLSVPEAALGVPVPSSSRACTLGASVPTSGSRWKMGRGLHFPSGAPNLYLAIQRMDLSSASRRFWILFLVPLSHPDSPDGKWSPRLRKVCVCVWGGDLLFMGFFFFFFSIFLK